MQPSDLVLEIGFGPGIAVREIARRVPRGEVVGIDRSAVMRAQAARRNAAAIRAGRVLLTMASVEDLPTFVGTFDKILAVNNMGMWAEPALRLKELAGLLCGGLIAIVSQPRCAGATGEATAAAARETIGLLEAAGFSATLVETLALKPPVACVIGTAPTIAARPSMSNHRTDAT